MQFPTHLIAGIFIQYIILEFFRTSPWISLVLIMIAAFCSHFFLDALAKTTYHPPERINDNFWFLWHVFVYGIGFILLIFFIWEYWLGILFANLPDLWDWYTLRNIASQTNQPDWGKKYYLHPLVDKIRSKLFFWLPNLTYNRIGILPELILIVIFVLFQK